MFPILPGPLRRMAPSWQADEGDTGSVRLRWCFDDETSVDHVLASEPMCYVDDGMLGDLVLPEQLAAMPPLALLELVAQAPHLEPEQRAYMAARLAAQGLDRVLPSPQALQTLERADIVPTPHLLLDSLVSVVRGELHRHDYALLFFDYDGISTEGVDAPVLRRVVGDTVELILNRCNFYVNMNSAASWPTTWGSARPSRPWPISWPRRRRGGSMRRRWW